MTYARARLLVGITGTGFFLIVGALAYALQLPALYFPVDAGTLGAMAAFTTFYVVYVLLSVPFDYAGGYWLPCHYNRFCLLFPMFWMKWLRAVAVQGAVMVGCGLAVFGAGLRWGLSGALGTLALLQLVLLQLQWPLARLTGGLKQEPAHLQVAGRRVVLAVGTDSGFSGGWCGVPGLETLVIPKLWYNSLSHSEFAGQMLRREGALKTRSRLRGVLLAMAWNLAGFALASQLPGAGLEHLWEFLTTVLAASLWSFAGLLALPSFSRRGVYECDHYAVQHGASKQSVRAVMVEVDQWQDDEPRRGPWVERLFHPVPSIENRFRALEQRPGSGFYHAARMALYLSWAQFGLFSRSVHCNSGRPELWVVLPGD